MAPGEVTVRMAQRWGTKAPGSRGKRRTPNFHTKTPSHKEPEQRRLKGFLARSTGGAHNRNPMTSVEKNPALESFPPSGFLRAFVTLCETRTFTLRHEVTKSENNTC